MHEESLVKGLLQQVEQIQAENGSGQVLEIQVEVGPLSGVEPLLFSLAFDRLIPGTIAEGARLNLVEVPLHAHCPACDLELEVIAFNFHCPHCQGNLRVQRGDGLFLTGLTLSDPTESEIMPADMSIRKRYNGLDE